MATQSSTEANRYSDRCTVEDQFSPLHLAAIDDNGELCQTLLKNESTYLNIVHPQTGNTPLHFAALYGCEDVAIILAANKKCNPNIANADGNTPLHLAATNCSDASVSICQAIVKVELCDLNFRNLQGDSPLHIAITKGNTELVQAIIAHKKCDLDIKNSDNVTPLFIAHRLGNVGTVQLLTMATPAMRMAADVSDAQLYRLTKWGNANVQDAMGNTPLHIAIVKGKNRLVQSILFHEKCDPNIPNDEQDTPLHLALCLTHVAIAHILIKDKRCNPCLINSHSLTPLHMAVEKCDVELCRLILANEQCNPNIQDASGNAPLHIAITKKNNELVQSIISHEQCNPNIPNSEQESPLRLAIRLESMAIAQALVNDERCDPSHGNCHSSPLHMAVQKCDVELCGHILANEQCKPNIQDASGSTPLHIAVARGNVKLVRSIMSHEQCDPNIPNNVQESPLHLALRLKNMAVARILVKDGRCNLTLINRQSLTPLHVAVQKRDLELCRLILANEQCNPNIQDALGNTPLHTATSKENTELVQAIIAHKNCDMGIKNSDNETPLFIAHRLGNVGITRLLTMATPAMRMAADMSDAQLYKLNDQCNPNVQDAMGNTLLHIAVARGNIGLVQSILCYEQCDPNIQNCEQGTPLHMALYINNTAIIQILVKDKRCNPSLINRHHLTPLHMAVEKCDVNLCRLILANEKCNPNIQDGSGNTPLHIAITRGNIEVVQRIMFLVQCNPNVQNSKRETPLHLALYVANTAIVQILVTDKRYYPSLLNSESLSPLHVAVQKWDVESCRLILSNEQCNPNVRDALGNTPLHTATTKENTELVQAIIAHKKCDLGIKNSDNETPLFIAHRLGNVGIARLLTMATPAMRMAADVSDAQLYRQLYKFQGNPNVQDAMGNTPLHIAIARGNIGLVQSILSHEQCDPNIPNSEQHTPFHLAIYLMNTTFTEVLVKDKRYNPSLINSHPLHVAVQKCDVELCRLILSNLQCNPNIQDTLGNTPLHTAVIKENTELVQAILAHKNCDLGIRNSDNETPLFIAIRLGNVDITRLLTMATPAMRMAANMSDDQFYGLNEQCNPNVQDAMGNTPLHIAVVRGDIELVQSITSLEKCDPNIPNSEQDTPLHLALCLTHMAIAHILIKDKRCNPSLINRHSLTPLHMAVEKCDVELCRLILANEQCNPNIQDASGNTPLHIAIARGNIEVIQSITYHEQCDPNILNSKQATPLHLALYLNDEILAGPIQFHLAVRITELCKVILANEQCNPNIQDTSGNTPLHIAAALENVDLIHHIVVHHNCNLNLQNNDKQTPLHIAAEAGNEDLCRLLLTNEAEPNIQATTGNTALHIATYEGNHHVVRLFATVKRCNINIQDVYGNTPLHIAAGKDRKECCLMLLKNEQCDLNVMNAAGSTALHTACGQAGSDVVKVLITDRNLNLRDDDGNTPLHLAVGKGNGEACELLLRNEECDTSIQNRHLYTSLHTAILKSQASIVKLILQHKTCEPTLPDSDGNTPLHLACMCAENDSSMIDIAEILLSNVSVNPECVNNAGQTPVELTTNYQLIQGISHFTECRLKQSVQTYIKVFVIGNAETGKSTLIKAICKEAGKWRKFLPSPLKRVRNISLHTAGIIPTTFRSKIFGNTILYDLAGQHEYYSSHAAVIENTILTSPPAFVVVLNISEKEEQISEQLRYWWSFIDNHAARATAPPHVILVGSHADKVKSKGESVEEKMSFLLKSLLKLPSAFGFAGHVALDCRNIVSKGMHQLCTNLNQSCTTLRKAADIDLRCHALYAFLLQNFPGSTACSISDIAADIKKADALLPQNPEGLVQLISSLSDRGLVFLVQRENSATSLVILQKQALFSEINGLIFAPEYFEQYEQFSGKTGIVPLSRIRQKFPNYQPEMIIEFLTHLEFCFKVDDHETLQRIKDEAIGQEEDSMDMLEDYYFFPALVSIENPLKVWQQDSSMHYQGGCYYKCIGENQYLTTRFLHVLILRLAFFFALAVDSHPSWNTPVICRRCSIWKHGIGWLHRDGIEAVVEVGLQCQWITIMMRCQRGVEVKCAQLRSAIIKKVLHTKDELCPAVKMSEAMMHPSCISYPFKATQCIVLYSIKEIANAIVNCEKNVLDQRGACLLPLNELLFFEPYVGVGGELLRELFCKDNSEKRMDENFLVRLANQIHPRMELYETAINPYSETYQDEVERESTPARKCRVLLQCLYRRINSTYENFHKELDKFSIFCGRDPMVLATHLHSN